MVYQSEDGAAPAADAVIDHIEFYVHDADAGAEQFVAGYGFRVVAAAEAPDHYSVALSRAEINLVFTEARTDDHPAAAFTVLHGDGVARIALRVDDAATTLTAALATGAQPADGGVTAFGDVTHTFVAGPTDDSWSLPGFVPEPGAILPDPPDAPAALDHIAICLEDGQLDPTVAFYEQVLGWRQIFEENIHVGAQAMQSKVVQSRSQQVTLTFLQPMAGAEPGQIDDFLKNHGGSGVQHLAFTVPDIVRAVDELSRRGVRFLSTPQTYYDELGERLGPTSHAVAELSRRSILADQDHDGQLFQIFTRSAHPRRTLFMELIERQGAVTFGSNNIRKLYEAVERQRDQEPPNGRPR